MEGESSDRVCNYSFQFYQHEVHHCRCLQRFQFKLSYGCKAKILFSSKSLNALQQCKANCSISFSIIFPYWQNVMPSKNDSP